MFSHAGHDSKHLVLLATSPGPHKVGCAKTHSNGAPCCCLATSVVWPHSAVKAACQRWMNSHML